MSRPTKYRGVALALLLSLGACNHVEVPHNTGLYLLVDTSGTYNKQVQKAEQIILVALSRPQRVGDKPPRRGPRLHIPRGESESLVPQAIRLRRIALAQPNLPQLDPEQRILRLDAQRALQGCRGGSVVTAGLLLMRLRNERRGGHGLRLRGRNGSGFLERDRCRLRGWHRRRLLGKHRLRGSGSAGDEQQ